jgi:hypothetical protein
METRLDHREETDDVVSWRRDQLIHTGFAPPVASRLARDPRYDVHALAALVRRGCPHALAIRILAPLDEEQAA